MCINVSFLMPYSAFLDGENVDRQHPRPAVLVTLLEIIERESFDTLLA